MLGQMMYSQPSQGLFNSSKSGAAQSMNYGGVSSFHNDTIGNDDDEEESGLKRSVFVPRSRKSLNAHAIVANIFIPWGVFTWLYGTMSFNIHYLHPRFAWASVILLGFGSSLYTGIRAIINWRRADKPSQKSVPMWYAYSSVALFIAAVVSSVAGDWNFWNYSKVYFDYMSLGSYPEANPTIDTGATLADSGRVYWAAGTHVDTKKTMGFKNGDMYCVAPIVQKHMTKAATYDSWAVGKNCCHNPNIFDCGDVSNRGARSSLRALDEEDRPFYRLAVQQAEAAYDLKAYHPVFFRWEMDPVAKVNEYLQTASRYFLLGIGTYFAANLFGVICAVFAFAKIGRM